MGKKSGLLSRVNATFHLVIHPPPFSMCAGNKEAAPAAAAAPTQSEDTKVLSDGVVRA
jgi:hypothetical protein